MTKQEKDRFMTGNACLGSLERKYAHIQFQELKTITCRGKRTKYCTIRGMLRLLCTTHVRIVKPAVSYKT